MTKLSAPVHANIMIVDDNPINLGVLEEMLQQESYEVHSFPLGRLALAAAANHPPDLILLDVNMPEMNGYEVCQRLKSDPKLAAIPVIFLSALDKTEDKLKAFHSGAADYVSKPFQFEEVHARVQTHLNLNALQRALTLQNQQLADKTHQLVLANEELDAFCSAVSHDLRAPLRSVEGFSRILLRDYAEALDEKGRDAMHRMRAATLRMGQLIEDLLQLSKISRSELQRQAADLSALAHSICDDLKARQPHRTVELDIKPKVFAQADPRLVRVVLENLLGNAWKFTARKEAACITFGASENQQSEVCYYVRDNGAGFDMAQAHQLFAPFQRLHSTAEFEGTGVGLATVQRVIHRHQGRIWADSAPDQGATFLFTLGESRRDETAGSTSSLSGPD